MRTALIAGATGLVGKYLLALLLASDRYDKVIALIRHDLPVDNPKLVKLKIDFANIDGYADQLRADDVFCCLGTTIAQAKTKEKFKEVDLTYPLRIAIATKLAGAQQYMLVSALGADKQSSVFYNRVKGEAEEAIGTVGFESFHIFRPSLLVGPRKQKRTGEDAAKIFFKIFGFLVPAKYKAIEASKVSKAMLYFAAQEKKGQFIHESLEMQSF